MSRSRGSSELQGITQPALVAERERIARELHKFTVHRLFGIGLKLQALSSRDGDPAVSVHLDECIQELDLAISHLRGLVFNLDARHV
jgi:signal transduction histidine kinase